MRHGKLVVAGLSAVALAAAVAVLRMEAPAPETIVTQTASSCGRTTILS